MPYSASKGPVRTCKNNQKCCYGTNVGVLRFSGYLLQTAQSWANAGVTEDGHCQGACRPQWFFYVPY